MTALYAIAGTCLAAAAIVTPSGVLAVAATMFLVAAYADHTTPAKRAERRARARRGYLR